MRTTRSKLLEIKDWLDEESLGPHFGTDYGEIRELLVSSIKDVKPTFLAEQFERMLEHNTSNPDEMNYYDKTIDWYEKLAETNKSNVTVTFEGPESLKPLIDLDTKCLFVTINEEKTNLYIIPYDKNYKVLREI